ncbi:MAG TPA: SulP family inorganic anion transporter [Burkholderiaceae bacterium]|nr:SulP family inorganic anion transporter [Burkholderiaceae bacterium]
MSGPPAGIAPTARPAWWPRRGDWAGGLTAALVMVAVDGSCGLIALAPLGPAFALTGFLWAVYAVLIAGLLTPLAGARGPLLCGPSTALALLVAGTLATLMQHPAFATGGQPDAGRLLAFVALGIALSGVLQLAMAATGLAGAIRYVPYPVHAGFMNAIAVLTASAVLPHALGVAPATLQQGVAATLAQAHPGTLAVALLTARLALRPLPVLPRVPAYLAALVLGTLAHHALAALLGRDAMGPLLGAVPLAAPDGAVWAAMGDMLGDGTLRRQAGALLQFALTVALIGSLQTLVSVSVVGGMVQRRLSGERELRAHGVANVVAGLAGALPSSAAVGRSAVGVRSGASSAGVRVVFALALLLLVGFGGALLRLLPLGAIAGIFLAVAWALVDGWSARATRVLARGLLRGEAPARSLAASYGVMLLVAGTAIFLSLAHGVALGVAVAMLMFIRSNIREPVRGVSHGDRRHSLKVRSAAAVQWLKAQGQRIAVLELDGPLFFGTADAVATRLEGLARESEQIVVDFRRVSDIDATGARILMQAAESVRRHGKHLLLASLALGDERTRVIREMDVHGHLSDADFFANADQALEQAEDRLLEQGFEHVEEGTELTLAQTMFGQGLSAEQLSALESMLALRHVGRGEAVFRRGDAADAMYVALRGQIGIWLPPERGRAGDRGHRLVSFAPGVVIGEMGLLENRPRSADAIAEEDAELLELTRAAYERLGAERPDILGRLFVNLSMHQSARMRSLTDALESALGDR